MKKLFTFISIIAMSYLANANYLTVDNNPGTIAQYTTVQAAIDAAATDDTVFISPSATTYAVFTVYKRLVIMGAGFRGLDRSYAYSSSVGSITIDSTKAGFSPNGSIINGLNIAAYNSINVSRSNISISLLNTFIYLPNSGSGIVLGSNSVVKNSIIHSLSANGTNNIIHNSIIGSVASGNNYSFNNSIFLDGISTSNSTLNNNLFINTSSITGSSNTFNKNVASKNLLPTTNNTNNINLFQTFQDSLSLVSPSWGVNGNFLKSDFKLKSTSPFLTYGTDGKQIGVYGGQYAWPSDRVFTGNPNMPKITTIEVATPVVEPGGTIKVNLKAKNFSTSGY